MVKKFEITSVKYDKLPDIEMSNKLLDVIHKKIKPSLSDISCKVDKSIILYGAGNLGKMAKEYFDRLNILVSLVIDKNSQIYRNDIFWNKIKVFSPKDNTIQVYKEKCLLVICIVTSSYEEISLQLKSEGWINIIPFYDFILSYKNKIPLENGWITSLLNKDDIKNMKYVLSKLKDDISRAHYLQFIAWHSFREEWIFKDAPISNENRYFIPEIVDILTDNETFIDIGAHHGEVVTKFMNITNDNFNKIIAIEPDKENISIFLDNMKERMIDYNISLITKALGEKQETKKFYHGLGYSSQLSNLSNDEIKVITLDSLNIKPTFIKIHAEGNEYNIIKGGIKTIMCGRPIIASTVYHNRDGLWKIQTQLMTLLENYVYYFRLHSWCGTGAVIYAIPKEKFPKEKLNEY